ncbi:MAG TPA: hypothetical protein VEZ20_15805 [Allosphingosinicella sp.]|jgi:hypothetical protein|nr:hypothetical protein [Allosphingosinicella sp.]
MRFRHARWYVLALFPLAALAFRPSYVAASMVLFETVGRWSAWHALFARAADLPVLPVMTAVAAAGAAIAWAGWAAGKRPVPEAAAAQPA